MKIKPMEWKDSDFIEGWCPPVVYLDEQGQWVTDLPDDALRKVRTLSPERSTSLYEQCVEICGFEGSRGSFRNRGMLYPSFPDPAWLQRQLELCGVRGRDPMLVLYGGCGDAGIVVEADTLVEFFPIFLGTIDDPFIMPISREWLIFAYHHGQTWFVRLD